MLSRTTDSPSSSSAYFTIRKKLHDFHHTSTDNNTSHYYSFNNDRHMPITNYAKKGSNIVIHIRCNHIKKKYSFNNVFKSKILLLLHLFVITFTSSKAVEKTTLREQSNSANLTSSIALLNALKHIQRSLEHYSLITAENLLKKVALGSDSEMDTGHIRRFAPSDVENLAENALHSAGSSSTEIDNNSQNSRNFFGNFLRVRVGLRETRQNFSESSDIHTNNEFGSIELLPVNNVFDQKIEKENGKGSSENKGELEEINLLTNNSELLLSSNSTLILTPSNSTENDELLIANGIEMNNNYIARRKLRSAIQSSPKKQDFSSKQVDVSSNKSRNVRHRSQSYRDHHHNGYIQSFQAYRRRRKGCPPMHGKDQLLCPSRNSHKYDVCITREQLCNHMRDCPNGEDENLEQCFFYKPLDDQLKTLSHAVLLLVESVMSEQQQGQQNVHSDDL